MQKAATPMANSLVLALIAALIAVLGQLLLKTVMSNIGAVTLGSAADFLALILGLLRQPLFYVAGLVYVLGFTAWLVVLSRVPLSAAYPVLALTYILIPLASLLLFREEIPAIRWLGMLIIAAGIVLVGLSYPR